MDRFFRSPLFGAACGLVLCLQGPQPGVDCCSLVAAEVASPVSSAAVSDVVPQRSDSPMDATFLGTGERQIEYVTERYADGRVKIQREVTLDDQNNYVNHGLYVMYDQSGAILRTGEYRMGNQEGEWMQTFSAGQGDLFSEELNKKFSGPFVSTATFVDGKLHGTWTIKSASEQEIIEWNFERGVRHGLAKWWFPNGKQRYELTFEHGVPVGEAVHWASSGEMTGTTKYIDGRPLIDKVKWYSKQQKQYEGSAIAAQELAQPEFDWWNTRAITAPAPVKLPELKHGPWIVWYPNGQKQAEGSYDRGLPVGKFTWWYDNGQKQAEGTYDEGLKSGSWTTWHANGMKESVGEYACGENVGRWMRWQADGRLVELHDFGGAAEVSAERQTEEETEQQVNTDNLESDDAEVSLMPDPWSTKL